jgi:hypothetical protein
MQLLSNAGANAKERTYSYTQVVAKVQHACVRKVDMQVCVWMGYLNCAVGMFHK